MALTLRTLLFGPLRAVPEPLWPWLLVAALLPLIGLYRPAPPLVALVLGLWLLLPDRADVRVRAVHARLSQISARGVAGLVLADRCASPGLRRASGPAPRRSPCLPPAQPWVTLPAYYADAAARDNYRGVAAYLAATGDPATRPGRAQRAGAAGGLALLRPRPAGAGAARAASRRPATTADALAAATADRRKVYALFWATDEADPGQVVERWLDAHAFKDLDAGRAMCALSPTHCPLAWNEQPGAGASFGGMIDLVGQAQPAFPQQVVAGEPLLVQLQWRGYAPITASYAVAVQLLDSRNQVIAQHDSLPAGGARPTTGGSPAKVATTMHLLVPFGAPPGAYRLIAALYDPETGARLPAANNDYVELGEVAVVRAPTAPLDVLPIQHRVNQDFGGVRLVGYDAYRKGFAHAPATPLAPGDLAHFTFYWQAPDPLPPDWPSDAPSPCVSATRRSPRRWRAAGIPPGSGQPANWCAASST
jgi:mannosyltransferase